VTAQLARLSLRDLGFGDRFDDAGYWKWHEHKKMGAAEAKTHLEGEVVRKRAPARRSAVHGAATSIESPRRMPKLAAPRLVPSAALARRCVPRASLRLRRQAPRAPAAYGTRRRLGS
jgi:hypothetical protein